MTEQRGNPPVPEEPPNAVLFNSRPTPARDTRSDDRDPLELHRIQTCEDDEIDSSAPSASSGDEYRMTTRRTTSRSISQRELEGGNGLRSRICRSWNRNVTLIVPQKSNRDYFGMLIRPSFQCALLTKLPIDNRQSTGKNIPGIHSHIYSVCYARGTHCSAIPTPTVAWKS